MEHNSQAWMAHVKHLELQRPALDCRRLGGPWCLLLSMSTGAGTKHSHHPVLIPVFCWGGVFMLDIPSLPRKGQELNPIKCQPD